MTTYRDAGVDLDAAAQAKELFKPFVRSTFGPQVLGDIGLFGGLFKLEGYKEPVLVSSTDGVGTKLKIAYWMGRYDTIGHDVVNQSVNDVLTTGAKPIFFLDYMAMEEMEPQRVATIVKGVADACRAAGCALIGGETSQMSGVFQQGAFELCGFVVGAAERSQLLDPSKVKAGDTLIAMPSSGLHTNGYSLVRHVFGLDSDPSPLGVFYPELGRTLGEALLEPHRSYYPLLAPALPYLKAMGHITGDGLEDNVARALPPGLRARIDYESWQTPALFRIIQERGNVAREEMFRVFNMGVGMVMTCEKANVDDLLRLLPEAWVIGNVTKVRETRVTVRTMREVADFMASNGFPKPGKRSLTHWAITVAHASRPCGQNEAKALMRQFLEAEGEDVHISDAPLHPSIHFGYPGPRKYHVGNLKTSTHFMSPFYPACVTHDVTYDHCSPTCMYGIKLKGRWVHELLKQSP